MARCTSSRFAPSLFILTLLAVCGTAPADADTLLVANKSEATLSLVDLDSGQVVATLPTGAGPHEVAVSPDGKTAVVANSTAPASGPISPTSARAR